MTSVFIRTYAVCFGMTEKRHLYDSDVSSGLKQHLAGREREGHSRKKKLKGKRKTIKRKDRNPTSMLHV